MKEGREGRLQAASLTGKKDYPSFSWSRLYDQMRFGGSMKRFVSLRPWLNICVVDLKPPESLTCVLVRKLLIASNKPHDLITLHV